MPVRQKTLRTCPQGHKYYKSSDCPVCPSCEAEKKPADGFLSKLGSPARNALVKADISTLEKLSNYSEEDLLQLHGLGPASLPKLRAALTEKGLKFRS